MYIEKYWGDFIGGSDDSLTFVSYLAKKQKKEIPVTEIFADFGLDQLHGDFRNPEIPLIFTDLEGWENEIHFAIELIADLAALLLECKINGSVDLLALDESLDIDTDDSMVCITATPKEQEQMNRVLEDFAAEPLAYDLSEMVTEDEMEEMAGICEALRKELYG
ncbi:MAG: hypothetical protein HFI91_08145 [Lachnospiraceae bacterium]|nr:hypothetical protein [Lachnospiraceae bacterium]